MRILATFGMRVLVGALLVQLVFFVIAEKRRIEPEDVLTGFGIGHDRSSLVKALGNPNLLVRVNAAAALAKQRIRPIPPELFDTLQDENAIVQLAAAKALSDLGSNAGIPVLKQLLTVDDPEVSMQAATILCKAGDGSGCQILTNLLKNSESVIRASAVRLVAENKSLANRRQLLFEASHDPNEKVRLAAIEALVEEPDGSTIDRLIVGLRDSDQVIRYGSNKWLKELTGQSFGFQSAYPVEARERAVEKWQAWWEQNRDSFAIRKPPEESR